MELRARVIVEGMWSGLNRSPYHGFSVEFSEYRQYSPGDDLRYLDWKALARSDKEFIKVFEDETNLRCLVLLDSSKSMEFTSGKYPKFEYAKTLVATLGYFLLQQRDLVGVARFDSGIDSMIEPRWRPGQFKRLLGLLDRAPNGQSTDMGKTLEALLRIVRKRSLILIISDFLSDSNDWKTQLGYLAAAGHDIRAIQVLDPVESTLDFGKPAYWEDIESGDTRYVDPDANRASYRHRFEDRQRETKALFDSLSIRRQTFSTDKPLDHVLLSLIADKRQSLARGIADA